MKKLNLYLSWLLVLKRLNFELLLFGIMILGMTFVTLIKNKKD